MPIVARAQQPPPRYAVQNYTMRQGLVGNEVVKAVSGKKGFLWLATHSGISRFDGRIFKNYTYVPGDTTTLRSIWVTDIALDKDSVLWASTEWGICYYDERADRFTYIAGKNVFTILYKAPLCTDKKGNIWVAAENGLFVIDPHTKQFRATAISRIKDPQDIIATAHNDIVVATRGDGLYLFSAAKNTYTHTAGGAPAGTHFMRLVAWNDSIWIASNAGLVRRLADDSFNIYRQTAPAVPAASVQQLMTAMPLQRNGKWFFLCGTYDKGLLLFDVQQKIFSEGFYSDGKPLFSSNSTVYDIESAASCIWLSTQTGLHKITPGDSGFLQHQVPEKNTKGMPLTVQRIISAGSQKDTYWIFSSEDNGTLLLYNQASGKVIKKMHCKTAFAPSNDNIAALLQDARGYVYTFANRYINVFSPAGIWTREINTGRLLSSACFDPEGNIWAGTGTGIVYYNIATGNITAYDNAFKGTEVEQGSYWQPFGTTNIECKDSVTVWLSSFKYGLFAFDRGTKKFTAYRQPFTGAYETLNRCSSLLLSGDTVWTGTMAGLTACIPRVKKFINYNSMHGLKSAYVYSLAKDAGGMIWGRGNSGVFYFDPGLQKFVNYSLPDAYNVLYFMQTITCIAGKCVLGLPGMYATFGLRQKNTAGITPVFSGMSAGGEKVIPGTADQAPATVVLDHTQNDIRIDFTAVNFSDEPVNFMYRLKGLDDKWTDNGEVNYASYSNLPSGDFVFEVTSRRGEEEWGSWVQLVKIHIAAAFWQTLWFKLLVAVLLAVAIISLYQWRIKKIEQRQETVHKLQQLELEQYKQQLEMEQIVNYFSSSLSNKTTREEVIWDVARNLIQKMGFANCMIYLWNDDKTVLLQKAGYGPNGSLENVVKEPFNAVLWQGIVGHVAATKKPIMLGDTSKDARYRPDVLNRCSELCVPALYNGELISVIDSEDFAKDYYTPQHLQALTTIATLMAAKLVAIEAAEDVRRKKEEINLMNEQVAQLELASLRSQMNPHFIFNSLNSVQKYIWESKEEDAAEYLAKFAKLMRAILENSRKDVIPLYEEVEVLKIYTELEHRRSNGRFDYAITVAADIDLYKTAIPPMLLQPFIENAVWHGLNKKPVKGNLEITISKKDGQLICMVDDDGVGRGTDTRPAAEKKSLGISITQQRIQRITETTKRYAAVEIRDKTLNHSPAGTTVIINLPLQFI